LENRATKDGEEKTKGRIRRRKRSERVGEWEE